MKILLSDEVLEKKREKQTRTWNLGGWIKKPRGMWLARVAGTGGQTGTQGQRDPELEGEVGGTHAKGQEWHSWRPKEERN